MTDWINGTNATTNTTFSANGTDADYDRSEDDTITAAFGLTLHGFLALVSAWCLLSEISFGKSRLTRIKFFLCMLFCALFDLPRYVYYAAVVSEYEKDTGIELKVCYSCHLMASLLFFMSFSLVVCLWTRLFEHFSSRLLRPRELAVANAIFGALAVATIINLFTEHEKMESFFKSF